MHLADSCFTVLLTLHVASRELNSWDCKNEFQATAARRTLGALHLYLTT
jgi:hypothetical protein